MFQKLKQFKNLRHRAKNMQSTLSEITVTAEGHGIKIDMDGSQKVLSLTLDPRLSIAEAEKHLPGVINDATQKAQRAMVEKMQAQGGLNNLPL